MIKNILSKTFGFFVNQRNKKYDSNDTEIIKCNVPVISVGNLSVGGTGKTPFVQMLGYMMKSFDHKPGVVGLGYKRKSKGEVIVSDGEKLLSDAVTAGDEMVLLAESLKVPVIAHDSKAQGAKSLESKFDVNSIIIDDGFQHRALHRDMDIVLIDKETAEKPFLMPEGRLREPLESLRRADVICLTGNFDLNGLSDYKREDAIVIKVRPYQGRVFNMIGRASLDKESYLAAKDGVVAASGIAKPERFYNMLKEQGYKVLDNIDFDDHHHYKAEDAQKLVAKAKSFNCNYIATTEKDSTKLIAFKDIFTENGITVVVCPIKLKIIEGKKRFMRKIDSLFEKEND